MLNQKNSLLTMNRFSYCFKVCLVCSKSKLIFSSHSLFFKSAKAIIEETFFKPKTMVVNLWKLNYQTASLKIAVSNAVLHVTRLDTFFPSENSCLKHVVHLWESLPESRDQNCLADLFLPTLVNVTPSFGPYLLVPCKFHLGATAAK